VKISPKRSPKFILEEGQTSRECHVKQEVPNSKGKECHVKKSGQEDRKTARSCHLCSRGMACPFQVARPCHLCSHGTIVPLLCCYGMALKCGISCLFGEQLVLARFSLIVVFFFFLMLL